MAQNMFTRLTGLPPTQESVAKVLHALLEDPDLPANVRAEAEKLLQVGHSAAQSPPLPPEIAARVDGMHERAARRVRTVRPEVKQRANQLLQAGIKAATTTKRVMWLQRAADAIGQGYADVAACRAGCSHCCLIPVKISQAEAVVMGKAMGRSPVPVHNHAPAPLVGDWTPCSFLRGGQCSIYVGRCRALASRCHISTWRRMWWPASK